MALRFPQGCPMENVDPMVGPVARPDIRPAVLKCILGVADVHLAPSSNKFKWNIIEF